MPQRALVIEIGARFGRLTVEARTVHPSRRHVAWSCRCDCGTTIVARGPHLTSGAILSCGCLHAERASERRLKHGQASHGKDRTKEYRAWAAAKNRCTNPKNNRYHSYGARGIGMCDRWLNSFEAFFEDMGPAPAGDYEIDRENVNGDYEPGNCRWIPSERQANNKTTSRFITLFDGTRMTVADAARYLGVLPHPMYKRLDKRWSFGSAVVTPIGARRAA